jgi:hypothetical protein
MARMLAAAGQLSVTPQSVNDWFGGRSVPTLATGLKIQNCIIYYNACILSELLERAERRQDYQQADAIKRANPASWKHVNLYGAYSLLDIGAGVDLQELVNLLEAARGRGAAAPD